MIGFTWVGLILAGAVVVVMTLAFEHRHDKRFFDQGCESLKLNDLFSRNMRLVIAKDNISITDLSNETGISRNTLTGISSGKTEMIRFDTVERLASHFDVDPMNLFSHQTDWLSNELQHGVQEERGQQHDKRAKK